jgi:hypothetical protein
VPTDRGPKAMLAEILAFVRPRVLAVEASLPRSGAPQAAVVGIVASDQFEVFFDTLGTSRKAVNLGRDARISLVIGWDLEDARTVQLEGIADEPKGKDLERLLGLYLARFPDGVDRQKLPDITYFRVRPTWIRSSDFRGSEPVIVEMTPVGSTWDAGRCVLETRLPGPVTLEDVSAWKDGLAHEVSCVPDGTRFKLLVDLRGFDPGSVEVHKAMREVVPRLLAAHGMRPAFIDLFDDRPEVAVTTTRGIECTAFANVHHDAAKMQNYESRIAKPNQRFFTSRSEAEAWLDSLPR